MATTHHPNLWRSLRQSATLAGIVALTVATTLLTQRFLMPSQEVHAQASPGVVQATEFDLVGSDGTVLARLQTGGGGGGNLKLYDSAGNKRVVLHGGGGLQVFDTDGTTSRFNAGYFAEPPPRPSGPPFNGVVLSDANGHPTMVLTTPGTTTS